jgi:hypothetical protein
MTNNFLAFLGQYFSSRDVNLTKSTSEYSLMNYMEERQTNYNINCSNNHSSSIYLLDKEFRKKQKNSYTY